MDKAFDSLIFDMDGTLWDATDSYVKCWNDALLKLGLPNQITRPMLESVMGFDEKKLMSTIFPDSNVEDTAAITQAIVRSQDEKMEHYGGQLYEGVNEGLNRLSKKYRLFMLSNCFPNTIHQFLRCTQLAEYFEGHICFGERRVPKSENIHYLMETYGLKTTAYVGDTLGDSEQSAIANVPFMFMTYGFGFGKVNNYHQSFDSFPELVDWFLERK